MADQDSMSGLTPNEAQEFHKYYIQGMMLFVAVAIVAHILVWAWKPWFQSAALDSAVGAVKTAATSMTTLIG